MQVSVPPNTAIKVEARTREGEIESDFDEIKVDNRDRESSASGSIGSNGPKLVVNCDKGTIEIRKGAVAVVASGCADSSGPRRRNRASQRKRCQAPKAPPVESEN